MFQAPVIDLYVTGICNLACPYCYGEIDTKNGMDRAVFLSAIDFAGQIGTQVIEFCGGEPLLYKDLEWAVLKARAAGFKLILRTNGLLISKYRSFIASNFDVVGISLDGDKDANHALRPLKKKNALSAAQKFNIPLKEVTHLKTLNPDIHILLASVATSQNIEGISNLARHLIHAQIPLDAWKVYQFLPNHFRAEINSKLFSIDPFTFQQLADDVADIVTDQFPVIYSKNEELDNGCLIIDRDGVLKLGSKHVGALLKDPTDVLIKALGSSGAASSINKNKHITYKSILNEEVLYT